MKKTLLALLALGASLAPFCSCNRQDAAPELPAFATITIGIAPTYDTGTFPTTKGIADEIAATLPSQMTLSLTNKASGESYEVLTGTQVRVPVGAYSVTGRTTPAVRQAIYGDTHYTSAEPLVVVEDDLEVETGRTTYTVTAAYRCFVLAAEQAGAGGWAVKADGEWTAMEHMTTPELWWTFVIGDFDADHPLRTMLTLSDGSGLDYAFYTRDPQAGGILARYGCWYLLRSGSTTPQSGSLSLALPEWTAGN